MCKYCEKSKFLTKSFNIKIYEKIRKKGRNRSNIYLYSIGEDYFMASDSGDERIDVSLRYCPMCGRPLSEPVVKFTMSLCPVTKKNHSRIVYNKRERRNILIPSAQYCKYKKEVKQFIPQGVSAINYPVNVQYIFYLSNNRKCDLTNLEQAADDILVEYGILQDDNKNIVVSHNGSEVRIDNDNPRTEVIITKIERK